jgi:hypothetical protein
MQRWASVDPACCSVALRYKQRATVVVQQVKETRGSIIPLGARLGFFVAEKRRRAYRFGKRRFFISMLLDCVGTLYHVVCIEGPSALAVVSSKKYFSHGCNDKTRR